MVYAQDVNASQFRIAINVNFIWMFLYKNNYKEYHKLPVYKIAELVEDEINMCNILDKAAIPIHDIIRKHIGNEYKKCDKT